jgi:hypothetical protein
MEVRFSRDIFARMADYDNLRHKEGQTYRRYADILMEHAYGLGIPKEALLRKFLNTMRRGAELRRFLVAHLDSYADVRALAAAVEQLTQEDDVWKADVRPSHRITGSNSSATKCRICGRSGHYAAACPRK